MTESTNISYRPTDGLSYDPSEPVYWDAEALGKEVVRTFEVCHGCRMCFKYCDAFPSLFSFLDERHDGDVRKLEASETREVMDACFQCKLCEVQCPYTVRDGHEFQLDFPKLVHRYQAVRTKAEGRPLRDRVLGDPDATARAARASLGLANVLNRVPAFRRLLEKTLGIHRSKLLPAFARKTFESWARATGRIAHDTGHEAVLFETCYVQHNEPSIGRDTVEVLEHQGVGVKCLEGLVCCGMPAWEHGDLDGLRERARQNLDRLLPHVRSGSKVVAINPTCSMMLRREYPELVDAADRERAREVSAAVVDPSEYVWKLREEGRFREDFRSSPEGVVAYHAPCHLRAQAVGFRARDLLRKLPGVTRVAPVVHCSGHDGTFSMKVEGFEGSIRVGAEAFQGMQQSGASVWASDCPLAALQLEQHAGRRAHHPMSILARAYRGEPFPPAAEENP